MSCLREGEAAEAKVAAQQVAANGGYGGVAIGSSAAGHRFRLKDKYAKLLREIAREMNFGWNYVSELRSRSGSASGASWDKCVMTAAVWFDEIDEVHSTQTCSC
ncbi:hypothetical protein AB4Y36_35725 [Paraburkholderia sp. BR10936]|uniref:hypothetical protein n=1 Tax=Paraburkholderia sp. BR10936 TaxID=3236993 RepID=UPI0034D38D22